MNNKVVGENIRRLRERAGFTQRCLAQFMHVDQSLVSKVESGDRNLSVNMLEKLATLFGVTAEQMETQGDAIIPEFSIAFRGSDLSVDEMEAIAAVNRIALNAVFMDNLLKGGKND